MSNALIDGLKVEENKTFTENGCPALKSSGDDLVNLFGVIGSLRSRNEQEIESLFSKAFAEDALLATKMSFYNRNVRGGQGERKTAKVIWRFLAKNYPEVIKKNIENIPFFGRFDDLYCLINTSVEEDMWKFLKKQIFEDVKNMNEKKPVSLCAKWLKSCNTSSKESVKLGKLTAKNLGLSLKDYRHVLSSLRAYINITETKMSDNQWKDINYEQVPSKAMNIYRNAFKKHDNEGFYEYISKVKNGTAKIKADTLFPYDIVEKYYNGWGFNSKSDDVLEAQWKALPNYVDGEQNVLVMTDVSGSMWGRPIATSIGLATYFAERNKGVFHNLYMSFSSKPQLVELKGKTLYEKILNVSKTTWGMNTNLESAFDKVLKVALKNNVPIEDMPKAIIVISDMEIDGCTDVRNWNFYDTMKEKYNQNGYEIPNIVFWNVASRHDVFHAFSDYKGVQLCSGQSASVFRDILQNLNTTPYQAMLNVLNADIYNRVII